MSSIIINLPSGYINAGLLLILEIFLINVLLASTRKRMESYCTYTALKKERTVPLRQVNILGFEARRDLMSITLVLIMIGTIIGIGIMEWGVNGETLSETVLREGFICGGDIAIGFDEQKNTNYVQPLLETSGYLTLRPTGKFLEISQKCSETKFYNHSGFLANSSRTYFSLQRVAVEKLKLGKRDSATLLYMVNSSITCFGDRIAVRPGPEQCRQSIRLWPFWNMSWASWKQEPRLYLWGVKQPFATRSDKNLDIDTCAEKLGYNERYQLRVPVTKNFTNEEARNETNYVIWDIHRRFEVDEYRYMVFRILMIENNGTYVPNFRGNRLEQYVEISSRVSLGHLIVAACLSSSREDSQSFHLEFADAFYSNVGNSHGYAAMFRKVPLTAVKLLGEYGTQMKLKFKSYPFQVPNQVTRIERWSLISFGVLLSCLISIRIVCEILCIRLPMKPNPMCTEWLGNEIIRNKAHKDDVLLEKPANVCLALSKTAGAVKIVIVNENDL